MKLKELTLSAVLTALCAVCAWITVPFTIPFTMQTFAVFLTCLLLGGKNATMVMAAYLSLGALGVPVFSGMNGGVGVLFGPTGGYLIGFLLLCPVYALVTHFWPGRKAGKAAGLLSGLLVLYAFGTVWFVFRYAGGEIGFGGALLCCVAPFVIPDLIKMGLAFLLAQRMKRFLPPLLPIEQNFPE